jgi:hypothetical protein
MDLLNFATEGRTVTADSENLVYRVGIPNSNCSVLTTREVGTTVHPSISTAVIYGFVLVHFHAQGRGSTLTLT